MYSKLSTQAIVLKTEDVGEKDVFLSLFTREFGFIYAKATGVRTTSSRLRFTLQTMTLCYISLVHGKTGWILTNATFIRSYYFDTVSLIQKNTLSHIIHLLGRLYIGEESHIYLFDFIENHLTIISKNTLTTQDTKTYELFTVFKMLEKLGYIQDDPIVRPLIRVDICSDELREYIFTNKKIITPFINNAIRSSGL
jgi:DNA repair protein RecO